ncbi:MAG: 6-phosphogluconolactonase [Balneola sp.]
MMLTHKEYKAEDLKVSVYKNRDELGIAAAFYVASKINTVLKKKDEVRMIFAAAASQREFHQELLKIDDIQWERVVAFQMDEYHTLPQSAPQRFGNFLKESLYDHKNFKAVHYLSSDLLEYEELIKEAPIDIVCMGIGENGHLAFNDPPVADFNDSKILKEVELDNICRQQQVNDGEFENIQAVPEKAVTLTIPTLLNAEYLSVVVPGFSKAKAVEKTLFDPIETNCPSTILRKQINSHLFLDADSSRNVINKLL